MAIKTIKNKIRAVKKTSKVTKAMEAVSAVKMRKSQERALRGRPYAVAALSILKRLSGSMEGVSHPLSTTRPVEKLCIVVFASDKGLAGALNSSVLKEAVFAIEKQGVSKENVDVVTVGRKAYEFFSKRGYTVSRHFADIEDSAREDEIIEITNHLIEGFLIGAFDACMIVYTNFKSTFEQKAMSRTVLPLSLPNIEDMVKNIVPGKGKYALAMAPSDVSVQSYTVEPDAAAVLDVLMPSLVNIALYHALLEARASEHSARMVAMKNASDKAREVSKDLTLVYNKARQALITREVSEIVGGMEAMAK